MYTLYIYNNNIYIHTWSCRSEGWTYNGRVAWVLALPPAQGAGGASGRVPHIAGHLPTASAAVYGRMASLGSSWHCGSCGALATLRQDATRIADTSHQRMAQSPSVPQSCTAPHGGQAQAAQAASRPQPLGRMAHCVHRPVAPQTANGPSSAALHATTNVQVLAGMVALCPRSPPRAASACGEGNCHKRPGLCWSGFVPGHGD